MTTLIAASKTAFTFCNYIQKNHLENTIEKILKVVSHSGDDLQKNRERNDLLLSN